MLNAEAPRAAAAAGIRRAYQPLMDAIAAYYCGGAGPERRVVPLPAIRIDPAFVDGPRLAVAAADIAAMHRHKRAFPWPALLMRRRDGSLWSYDDVHYLTALRRHRPEAQVDCLIFDDATG
jgi:hypothetical protein